LILTLFQDFLWCLAWGSALRLLKELNKIKELNKKELKKLNLINNNNKKKCKTILQVGYNRQLNTYKKTFKSNKCNNNNQKIFDHIINKDSDNACNLVYNSRTLPELTNNNCINQLFPRITKTNPNIFKGRVNQTLENIIISSEETSQKKSTNTEHINKITPLNINVENYIFNRDYNNDSSRKSQSSRDFNKKKILHY
jgi:hypothetical protein